MPASNAWFARFVPTQHLLLRATAVFLAVIVWFVVTAKEPLQELVRVRLVPELDSSLVLRDPTPDLQALVVASSPKEFLKLNSSPLVIRRPITADAPDTLVLDFRPSDVVLPEGVDAVVRDIQPRSVTLRFDSTWTRRVPVRPAISLLQPVGAGPSWVKLDPDSVQVSGPRHAVVRVEFVRTVSTTITLPDSLPHLIDLDTTALGLRVKPAQVRAVIVPVGTNP